MRAKIVAGNWKMNKTLGEAVSLTESIVKSTTSSEVQKIIIPPFPFIFSVSEITKSKNNFFVGAQNLHDKENGAYTGEISAPALKSVGATHVLVGHSERRTYFHESAEFLKNKINTALHANLTPIYCFGEQLAEREAGKHFEIIEQQLNESLFHLSAEQITKTTLAYEPVWAIGTGKTASPQQAQEIHQFIRACIEKKYSKEIAITISILYGGSCNAQNAKELFSMPDIDGGLIGGASLKAEDFVSIINSFA